MAGVNFLMAGFRPTFVTDGGRLFVILTDIIKARY